MKLKILCLILLSLVLTGCGRYFLVDVDSICTSTAKAKKKYILLPGNKDCKASDLQFIEFSAYADRALQRAGFVKASSLDEADVGIILGYGISDPQTYQYTYSVPQYGQTGVSSSTTSGNVYAYSNSVSYSQTTTYKPSYGVVGYTTHVGTSVYYVRYLALSGYDLTQYKKSKKVKDADQIWTTNATSVGASGDLREIFPILLAASQEHIAESSGKVQSYKLSENDKRIRELQN